MKPQNVFPQHGLKTPLYETEPDSLFISGGHALQCGTFKVVLGQISNQLRNCRHIQSAVIRTTITNRRLTRSHSHSKFKMSHGVNGMIEPQQVCELMKNSNKGGGSGFVIAQHNRMRGCFFYDGDFWLHFQELLALI